MLLFLKITPLHAHSITLCGVFPLFDFLLYVFIVFSRIKLNIITQLVLTVNITTQLILKLNITTISIKLVITYY